MSDGLSDYLKAHKVRAEQLNVKSNYLSMEVPEDYQLPTHIETLIEGDYDGDIVTYPVQNVHHKEFFAPIIPPSEGLKFDTNKPDHSLLPPEFLDEVAKAFMNGETKYGRYNFTNGIKVTRLLAAALRHINAYSWGENNADDSKLNHLGHAGASIAMALWMIKNRPELDDRYKGENNG